MIQCLIVGKVVDCMFCGFWGFLSYAVFEQRVLYYFSDKCLIFQFIHVICCAFDQRYQTTDVSCKCPVTIQFQSLNWPTAFCFSPVHCVYQVVSPWNELGTSYFCWSRLHGVTGSQLLLLVAMNRRMQLHSCLKSVVNW